MSGMARSGAGGGARRGLRWPRTAAGEEEEKEEVVEEEEEEGAGLGCAAGRMHRCLNRLIELGFAKSSVETPKCSVGIPPLALIIPVIWPALIEASAESKNDFFRTKRELNASRVPRSRVPRAAMFNGLRQYKLPQPEKPTRPGRVPSGDGYPAHRRPVLPVARSFHRTAGVQCFDSGSSPSCPVVFHSN